MNSHAQLSSKDAIIIVPGRTKLPRSDKGSVLRKDVIDLFATEILRVYSSLDNSNSKAQLPSLDMDLLEQGIKDLIQSSLA